MNFSEHLKKYLNQEEIDSLLLSFNEEERKGVLLNTNKITSDEFIHNFPNVKKHPVVENAFIYNKSDYELGKKIYHELGAYYIQEPSAILVANLLDLKGNERVLDLCAAPGGKTFQTSLKLNNGGILVANDLSKERANVLLSNIERLGLGNVIVTSLDFSKIFERYQSYFDAIILDAPCSGSGMFRKMSEMKDDWTYEKVLKNAAIQKQLIKMCYYMLKEGGQLIYSTCSYSFEEDEEVVEFLLNNSNATLVNIDNFKGEFRSRKFNEAVHLFPSKFPGEGHFICKIKKPGLLINNKSEETKYSRTSISKGNKKEELVFLIPQKIDQKLLDLSLRPGLLIETKGKDYSIPSHHYSHFKNAEKSIELTKEEVVKYFNGETINKKAPNGYAFVSFNGLNIGTVHVVNNVLKNLYPKGLRLKLSINDSF